MNNTRQKIALIAPKTGLEDFLKKHGVSEIVHTEKNPYLQHFLAYHPDKAFGKAEQEQNPEIKSRL